MPSGFPLFPAQASTLAPRVDNLYFLIVAITAFFAVIVSVMVVAFAIKYRTNDPNAVGERIHGSIPLELFWTLVPFVIAIGIFFYSVNVYFDIVRPPDQTLEVYSVGKQWMWKFQHIGGQAEINELHVPLGRAVKVTFTSEDVIHDMFIPAFRVKADAIPGRYSTIWFTPTKVGEYHLFCSQYCGTRHSAMTGTVYVMEPADYQAWLAGAAGGQGTLSAQGERLFAELACTSCHTSDNRGRGPALNNVFNSQVTIGGGQAVTADETYLRESILNPQAKIVQGYQPLMPTFQGVVSEENLMALIEYVKSLHPTTEASAAAAGSTPAAEAGASPENQ